MLSTKIRIIIAGSVAVATLSVPGAASAAMLLRSPATVTTTTVVQPTHVSVAREVGSAGVEGYSDEKCEKLRNESTEAFSNSAYYIGKSLTLSTYWGEVSSQKNQELEDNCLVVD